MAERPELRTQLEDGTLIRTWASPGGGRDSGRTAVYRPGKTHWTEMDNCGSTPTPMRRSHERYVALATARQLDYQIQEDMRARRCPRISEERRAELREQMHQIRAAPRRARPYNPVPWPWL